VSRVSKSGTSCSALLPLRFRGFTSAPAPISSSATFAERVRGGQGGTAAEAALPFECKYYQESLTIFKLYFCAKKFNLPYFLFDISAFHLFLISRLLLSLSLTHTQTLPLSLLLKICTPKGSQGLHAIHLFLIQDYYSHTHKLSLSLSVVKNLHSQGLHAISSMQSM
jgi:hypothetical protein